MNRSGRQIFAAILIILGVAFLLDQLNIPVLGVVSFAGLAWPLILIVLGVFLLARRSLVGGWILVALGVLFGLSQITNWNVWATFWPLVLIVLGIVLLYRRASGRSDVEGFVDSATETHEHIDETAVFSGLKRIVHAKNFKGGTVTAVFGGAEIDLTGVELRKEGAVLNVTVIFGGATIRVPQNIRIDSGGTPILGGWENKFSSSAPADAPRLKIHGTAIFGGVEVKN